MLQIFISYKRADHNEVCRFIKEIEEKTGAKCWLDLAGIETSAQFVSVICDAIDKADIFLFMHSASHVGIDFQTDWTIRELNYAISINKRIVLVKMDSTPLENLLLMFFSGTNNVQITDHLQKQKFFLDLNNWSDKEVHDVDNSTNISTYTNKNKIATKYVLWSALLIFGLLGVVYGFYQGHDSKKGQGLEQDLPSAYVSSGVDKVNGFEYVDLGLPSGLKWARCNVGASQPFEYGDFYAWGEVVPKSEYTSSNLSYFNETADSIILLKYNDGANTLDTEDDAASVNLGKNWRIPTKIEVEELIKYCNWERSQLNGVPGEKVTGVNGNSIFLPYAGFKYLDEHREEGQSLSFWTSTLNTLHPERAYYLYSGISGDKNVHHTIYDITRYPGTTIRAVTD